MIPAHTHSHVLPPFTGTDPTVQTGVSPYDVSMMMIVDRFATSPERVRILNGLLSYRAALAAAGFVSGYQWVSGSFTENVEVDRGRPPGDVDIVTIASRPLAAADPLAWKTFVLTNANLFNPASTKQVFECDAYFIDLNLPPVSLVSRVSYWYGLFSHKRDGLWKGMLRVPLGSDDAPAQQKLTGTP